MCMVSWRAESEVHAVTRGKIARCRSKKEKYYVLRFLLKRQTTSCCEFAEGAYCRLKVQHN